MAPNGSSWLCTRLFQTPQYALPVYEPKPELASALAGADIRTTSLQKMPKIFRRLHKFLPMLRVRAFQSSILSEFDIILSSSSAEAKQVKKTRAGQVHICYCHTPIRYYWSHYKEYKQDPGFALNWLVFLAMPFMVPPLCRLPGCPKCRRLYCQLQRSSGPHQTILRPPPRQSFTRRSTSTASNRPVSALITTSPWAAKYPISAST